jgi:hypothetical protein
LSPVRISPEIHPSCLPSTAKAIPRGDVWLHEAKLDSRSSTAIASKSSRTAACCPTQQNGATGLSVCYSWPRRWQVFAAGPQRSTQSWSFPLARAGRIFAPCVALIDRRLKLTELVARSSVRAACTWCRGFDNGAKLPEAVEASFRSANHLPIARGRPAIG